MRLALTVVDAFVSGTGAAARFSGNPAAVVPLERWLDASLMQSVAAQNNLSETAFFVPEAGRGRYALRWFTPAVEVDLCGHATLASAHVVLSQIDPSLESVEFSSRSGPLAVARRGELLALDFPARPAHPVAAPAGLDAALGARPRELLAARDLVALLESEEEVRDLRPDFARLAALDAFAVCVTAPGGDCDFVSRFFAPAKGIDEDPVTGSAHCTLVPLWAERLGKRVLRARQLSRRGGELLCALSGERVEIAGRAREYLRGTIEV